MAPKKRSSRGAVVGLIFLVIAWISGTLWFFLPYTNRATTFPDNYFAPPPAQVGDATVPETDDGRKSEPRKLASFAGIDAFVTQEQGYAVVRSDFGVGDRLYQRRDFRMAQEKADELYERRNDGRQGSIYGGFLSALGRLGNEENVDSMLNTLKNWQQTHPQSHYPVIVEAILRMNLAEAIRSGAWSSKVGRAATLGFDTNMRQAKTLLDRAQELQPDDAEPAIRLMRVVAALNLPEEKAARYFEYAYERSPQCYPMWARRLLVLAPRWDEVQALMARAEQEAKKYPQVELTVVDGLVEMHNRSVSGVDLMSPEQWRQIADIFERVLAAYPEDLEILSLYAKRASEFCPDPVETAEIFDRIGDQYLDGGHWDSLAQYNRARTHAYVAYARDVDGPEAIERIDKAYELSPEDWYVAYHYGISKASQNELEPALDALLRAVDTNPSFVPALNAAAHVYLHLEDFENAGVYANRALVRQPLGKLLYEAEALLADAEAEEHADAGEAVVPHTH